RAQLKPVDVRPIKQHLHEPDGLTHDQIRGDGRFPGAVALDLGHGISITKNGRRLEPTREPILLLASRTYRALVIRICRFTRRRAERRLAEDGEEYQEKR